MTLATLERIFATPSRPITAQHRATLQQYVEPLTRLMREYGINTPLRQAHFLAQLAHESGELRYTEENLKYSATRLREVFPKYFRTEVEAKRAAYNPEAIANTVYANRLGNGTPQSGDGYRFRGRGLIQLTGRSNYEAFYRHLKEVVLTADLDRAVWLAFREPDPLAAVAPLVARPELAVRSACWYWKRNNLNALADQGANDTAVTAVTRRINGGTNGLAQRKIYFYRAQLALKG